MRVRNGWNGTVPPACARRQSTGTVTGSAARQRSGGEALPLTQRMERRTASEMGWPHGVQSWVAQNAVVAFPRW